MAEQKNYTLEVLHLPKKSKKEAQGKIWSFNINETVNYIKIVIFLFVCLFHFGCFPSSTRCWISFVLFSFVAFDYYCIFNFGISVSHWQWLYRFWYGAIHIYGVHDWNKLVKKWRSFYSYFQFEVQKTSCELKDWHWKKN